MRLPSRGGVERDMNSMVVGSLSAACRSAVSDEQNKLSRQYRIMNHNEIPSLASSSRIGAPPISNITRPVGTLDYSYTMSSQISLCL